MSLDDNHFESMQNTDLGNVASFTRPDDSTYIRQTFELAREAREQFNHPFGALLVQDGKVVMSMADQSTIECDPSYHPEVAVIREYCRKSDRMELGDVTLYSSTEPCVMCSATIRYARIPRVVFGVSRATLGVIFRESRDVEATGVLTSMEIINRGGNACEINGPLLEEEGIKVFEGYEFPSKCVLRDEYILNLKDQAEAS